MAFELDGLAVLRSMAAHPETFAAIEAEASRIARTLLTKALKDRGTMLSSARAMASALPDGTLAHVTDAMTDAEIAALATKFDRLNPALKAADRHAKAILVGELILGAVEPAAKAAPAGKAVVPERGVRKKASTGIESARKVLHSKAMGARKAVKS